MLHTIIIRGHATREKAIKKRRKTLQVGLAKIEAKKQFNFWMLSLKHKRPHPTDPFTILRATQFVDQRILCSSEVSTDGSWSSRTMKRLGGRTAECYFCAIQSPFQSASHQEETFDKCSSKISSARPGQGREKRGWIQQLPGRIFYNFRASKTVDRRLFVA